MSVVKEYFKEETKWEMFGLEHPKPADFHLCVYQRSRSSVPLLIFRAVTFLVILSIILASKILYIQDGIYQFWFIYLTHWGLIAILLTTGFATFVSARIYVYGPISADVSLPWYVKVFWVLYNIANPMAYLITVFYWTILYEAGIQEEGALWLDVLVHAINTVIMLVLLFSSSQPSRLLHLHHPVMFGLAWVIFSVIYYLAGGVNPKGFRYIYPVIDWSSPGIAIGYVVATAVLLGALHLLTMGLASLRDYIARRFFSSHVAGHVEEGTPLRTTVGPPR